MANIPKPNVEDVSEERIQLPPVLLKAFGESPRIVLKKYWAGLWPLPPELLKNAELIQKLATDKEFARNFELIAVPKQAGMR